MGVAHDRLLDFTEEVSDEDPFAALRLLQTCGIQRFGHVLSAVPPDLVREFAAPRDETISSTFATIHQSPASEDSTHTLPVGAGGAGLTSLAAHAEGIYTGAFFRIARPLQQRLAAVGGSTNRELAAALHNPVARKATRQWADTVHMAHDSAKQLQLSFSPAEGHVADTLAPRGNTIFSAGEPTSEVVGLPPTIDDEDFPELH
jgi:hypothetical protein